MKEGPDIARLAALIGDPARANMLTALISGKALTATELAAEAGVTASTASAHLAKLEEGGLVLVRRQGRHRYAALADAHVAEVLESLMGLAASRGHVRTRTGPRDPALRKARVCYDHLAGELAVALLDRGKARGLFREQGETLALTDEGCGAFAALGFDLASLGAARRPICRSCLDWSARRSHLAGGLGAALFDRVLAEGWARREPDSRLVSFTREGEKRFDALLA